MLVGLLQASLPSDSGLHNNRSGIALSQFLQLVRARIQRNVSAVSPSKTSCWSSYLCVTLLQGRSSQIFRRVSQASPSQHKVCRKTMAKVAFEDLSGTSTPVTSNPYDGLINACHNDPVCNASRLVSPLDLIMASETNSRTICNSSNHKKCPTT